ncbi:hypothetical protein [[Kitasatospora] papulosa]|uniref:hypothetical protein n=1 Tax=[Kitasatospora] papulosa TaxID=1464011 RepID=UPI0036BEEE1B
MSFQTGVRIYQFVRDRLDDERDARHPHGHEEYVMAWSKAAGLSQDHVTAVASADADAAERVLQELYGMAAGWKYHPDYPSCPARDS